MGTPTVIIQNGKIIKKNMKKVHLDTNELLEECRIKGYFDISNIAYGIMEANGEMSFLPKASYKSLTPNDLELKIPKEELVANIIIDGKIMHSNLKLMHKDEVWLKKQLKVRGLNDYKDIILCTSDSNEKIIIYNDNNMQVLDILE